jgi:subtilase family serine protease
VKPAVDPTGGWEVEESLDIEWAHAMAPEASLYLVEAQSGSTADLMCAVTVAANLVNKAGGGEVSMSFGGGEFAQEAAYDSIFATTKVVYFAAAGDSPGTSWPSVSPNVISVGGTTLSRDPVNGSLILENVWQDAGGGPSVHEPRPTWQDPIRYIVGANRGTPDIALVANPNTGVWILGNFMAPPDVPRSVGISWAVRAYPRLSRPVSLIPRTPWPLQPRMN